MSINDTGTTILMVTHNSELARRAQRQVHMVDGQTAHDLAVGSTNRVPPGAPIGALSES